MKFFLRLMVAALFITACTNDNKTKSVSTPTAAVETDPLKDSANIRSVIIDFYNWYNKNYTKLMRYDLYDGIKKKDEPPYVIKWKEVEKYHQFIRDSVPGLGEQFMVNQRHFFEQCDSAFKKD